MARYINEVWITWLLWSGVSETTAYYDIMFQWAVLSALMSRLQRGGGVRKRQIESVRERERERSVLGSPESSGWKVAWLLLTCVADRVSLETGTFVASRVILCVSLPIIVEKMLRHVKKLSDTDLNALLTCAPNMPNRHADVCINTSACEETSTPTDRHTNTHAPLHPVTSGKLS